MEKEKKDFILKRGVLGVGLPVAFLMSITLGFQKPGSISQFQSFNPKMFFWGLALYLPVFFVAGFFWGLWVYKLLSRKKK